MMPKPSGLYTRKYGQVLLKNLKVANFEVASLGLPGGSLILEIGPGPGVITEILLKSGYRVKAVESDHRFFQELSVKFSEYIEGGSLELIKADFLQMKGETCDGIIGNVPYHISSEIVFRLPVHRFQKAVLMFQREFCRRLVAEHGTGDYSRLSVNAQLRYRIRIIANVSRRSFYPVPEVDSSVVELMPRGAYPEEMILRADSIFRKLFSARRKKISGILKGIDSETGEKRVGEIPPEELLEIVDGYITRQSSP